MKIIKFEQEVITPKTITIELTEKELDFIVLAIGRISIPTAEKELNDYCVRKPLDFTNFLPGKLWEGLMQYSNLKFK
jgi:hypothetical protein